MEIKRKKRRRQNTYSKKIMNINSKPNLGLTNCQEFSHLRTAVCTEDHQEQMLL